MRVCVREPCRVACVRACVRVHACLCECVCECVCIVGVSEVRIAVFSYKKWFDLRPEFLSKCILKSNVFDVKNEVTMLSE